MSPLVILLIYSRKTRFKLKRKLFFYKEKYNSLWANYQLSTKQLENLRQELIKQNKQGNSELNSVLKDLSIHFNTFYKTYVNKINQSGATSYKEALSISENNAVFSEIGSICPLQNAQPLGAKLYGTKLISPNSGSTPILFSF